MIKVMKCLVSIFLVVSLTFLQTGCSAFAPSRQKISVTTSEPDAEIYINGEFIGQGTATKRVPRNQSVSIMAKKEGYLSAIREVDTELSMTGILDTIGGFCLLVPFIGLIFPGARSLDTNNVAIVLQKDKK